MSETPRAAPPSGLSRALALPGAVLIGVAIGNENAVRVPAAPKAPPAAPVDVYFSPDGGCTAAAVAAIDGSKKEVLVQAYSFTSRPIADALARAHARGVAVSVVLDDGQRGSRNSLGAALAAGGIPVAYDGKHAIAHNKLIIVDGAAVVGGSFNQTAAAEHANAENLTVIRDRAVAGKFRANWELHKAHSVPAPGAVNP